MDNPEKWRLFWAKTDRSGERPEWTRPLWAHLIDVANAASALWDCHVSMVLKEQLATACGLSLADAGRWWSLMIGLHDLGKAIPSFQTQHAPTRLLLERNGFKFPAQFDRVNCIHHGYATIGILEHWLQSQTELAPPVHNTYKAIAAFIGFHHGMPVSAPTWREDRRAKLGGEEWRNSQMDLLSAVQAAWNAPTATLAPHRFSWPKWVLGFAGWCTLSDWIGSMEEFFPDVAHDDDLQEYIEKSETAARRAIESAGFDHRAACLLQSFEEMFTDSNGIARSPRHLQKLSISDIPVSTDQQPTLTIIEAPTGEGKTEAAFYLALRQQVAFKGSGIYIAMPSQATSNGLFERFKTFLAKAQDPAAGPVNLVLVHGASSLHKGQEELVRVFLDAKRTMSEVYDEASESAGSNGSTQPGNSRVETAGWFLPKKRSLLAPYGIGTVDQALLGVLFSKHFFLRLYGLSGKTVIFDEVHAYDTYMSELFRLLLTWLKELGTNVILLSATLPSVTRRSFIEAWGGMKQPPPASDQPHPVYPVVWHTGRSEAETEMFPCTASYHQTTFLQWSDPSPDSIVEAVLEAVRSTASVAVIVNTVRRAQNIYRILKNALEQDTSMADVEITLFHGRFPHALRATIEHHVLDRFGEKRPSLRPAILIATQVAEQSLDLDVDAMFSDLAPVDLLLQRAGRLHRHHHHQRPEKYARPILTILCSAPLAGELPAIEDVSGGGKVYERAVLYRTWRELRTRESWALPEDYRPLVESVYSLEAHIPPADLDTPTIEHWEKAERQFRDNAIRERNEAGNRIIQTPGEIRNMIATNIHELDEEDDSSAHRDFVAFTRLGGPSVQAVCIHEDSSGQLWLDPGHSVRLPTAIPLGRDAIRSIQDAVVRLSGERIYALLPGMTDARWKPIADNTPGLTRHRPLIFRDCHWYDDKGNHIEYDEILGIIYHKRES